MVVIASLLFVVSSYFSHHAKLQTLFTTGPKAWNSPSGKNLRETWTGIRPRTVEVVDLQAAEVTALTKNVTRVAYFFYFER